jgi:hypothetical protein
MTQPGFDFAPPSRPRKRGHVERTSVLAYRERPRDQRVADMVTFLGWHYARIGTHPTSAELSQWVTAGGCQARFASPLEQRMWFRRGLSDALAAGLVAHAGQRECAVSGRTCLTWRTVGR